jgi:large subunit ribosomal protein L9
MANTQIILMQRVENLGQMGDIVSVKPGYARNYLLPAGKAMRATKSNIAYFETQKKLLETENLKKRSEAEAVASKMGNFSVVILRQASEGGQLYGSVTTRDIAEGAAKAGVSIDRTQIYLNQSFKTLGLFKVDVYLHPEVKIAITINVARTEEEAKVQAETGKAAVKKAEELAAAAEVVSETPAPASDDSSAAA